MSNPALTELLASYVPKLIQHRVVADPTPIDAPVAENLQAAILFADISGFTLLTERMVERGPTGVETLARILNEYFGQLIDIIHEFGGDVVKFAGDAVIAVWPIDSRSETVDPAPRTSQWNWTLHAAECAVRIRERLSNYQVEGDSLYLKLAVSTGDITATHVGGVFSRWEFILTGNPLVELGIANNLARAGEVLLTPSAWKLLRGDCIAEPVEFELKDTIAQGGRVERLTKKSNIPASHSEIRIPEGAENSLRAYIPGAIINRLSAGQSSWIAELRRVTVLFINLPGIDNNTALESSQNIARLIQRSVYRYEGSINKINVDDKGITIVAALGLPPFSHEDDPARGVQAALMIRKELNNLKIHSYIGITTGRIFCGSVGNDARREYTIIGNAVNMSARLMGAAGGMTKLIQKQGVPILCDRATFDSAKDVVEFESFPTIQVKGRTEPVEVFHPVELKKSVIRPKAELIGRQEEKAIIASALQEFSRGAPHQTLILQGEAGIGKSRLFEDLVRQAETLDVNMFNGGGDAIEKNSPYHAWRPVFNKIFDIEELVAKAEFSDETRNVIQNSVFSKLAEIDPDLSRYAPLLDVILPVQIPDNELTSAMTGEIRGGNIRELLTSLLSFESRKAPVVMVLEDLHWFDSASWALLVDVQQKVRPILLALNTRPLPDPAPNQFKQILEMPDTRLIKLEAMMLDDVESLVCQRLGVKSVPAMIGRLIREKSEGHPFFAEELAYALRDSGILMIENQECRLNVRFLNFEDLTLPDTLQAAITNRIDSLNPSHQLTLKVASVIGRIFAFRVLQAVHPIEADKPSLPAYMTSLTKLSLTLVESEGPDLAYIFKHAVTQEVAYNLMLFSQRRQLHQAVAEWIEKNNQDNIESFYTLLAHHWTQASEMPDAARNDYALTKALEYLEKAGEQAMQNYANQEAIQFFSQALEWEAKLSEPSDLQEARERKFRRAGWHSRMALAQYSLGQLPACNEQLRLALKLLDNPLPASGLQFILGLLAEVFGQALHRYFPSRYIGSLTGQDRDVALAVARLYELIGRIFFYSNETIPIMYSILRFLNVAERAGSSPELAASYSGMAVLAGIAQLLPLADGYVKRAMDVANEVNQLPNQITVRVVNGAYLVGVGRWNDVRQTVEEAKTMCEQLGDSRQWGDCVAMLAESAFISADYDYSLAMQQTLLEDARRRRSPLHMCWGLLGMSVNYIGRGRMEDAIPMLEEALQILDETPNLASSIETNGQLALAYFRLGQDEKAISLVQKVFDLAGNISPTVYSTNIGFTGVADVCFERWERALQDPTLKADLTTLKELAEKSLKLLRSFEKVFPIGKPATPIYQGWYEWLTGTPEAAIKSWNRGLEAAQKLHMPYEEGLLRLKLGAHLKEDAGLRSQHLERASQIFEKIGAVREYALVREVKQK